MYTWVKKSGAIKTVFNTGIHKRSRFTGIISSVLEWRRNQLLVVCAEILLYSSVLFKIFFCRKNKYCNIVTSFYFVAQQNIKWLYLEWNNNCKRPTAPVLLICVPMETLVKSHNHLDVIPWCRWEGESQHLEEILLPIFSFHNVSILSYSYLMADH